MSSSSSLKPPGSLPEKVGPTECPEPTTVFEAWGIVNFDLGPDGVPVPIQYNTNNQKAHKVSIMDIDEKDTRMKLYIDDIYAGVTSDFEVNKTMNCGDDLRLCLQQGYSSGVIIVPPGRHEVKIEYSGKGQFINMFAFIQRY